MSLVLSAMLASGVALADPGASAQPPATAAPASKKDARRQVVKDWWLWTLVAVLSAGTIVTSAVVASVPRGSLNSEPSMTTATVTLRF